jgi:hypothetical protein
MDVNHLHPEKVTMQSGLMINTLIEKEIHNPHFLLASENKYARRIISSPATHRR